MSQPVPMKTAAAISAHIKTLMQQLTTANGSATNIGRDVMAGRLKVDDDRPPCVVIIEGEDRPGNQGGLTSIRITVDYALVAYLPCDADNPNDAAHLAIKEMKQAIFGSQAFDRKVLTVDYQGREIGPRPDGVAIVMAVLLFSVTFAEELAVRP